MRTTARLGILAATCLAAPSIGLANGDTDLLSKMSQFQYLGHKAELAIEHENRSLAAFYAHELEETLETVEAIDAYDGYPVGDLTEGMLRPGVEQLNNVLEDDSWQTVNEAFDGVIRACNACHQATEHGFIRVQRGADNSYMQDFAPIDQGE